MAASSSEKQTGKEEISSEVKETNFSSNADVVEQPAKQEEPESLIAKQEMSDSEGKVPDTNLEDKVSGTDSDGEISGINCDAKNTSQSVVEIPNSIENRKNVSDSDKDQGTVEKVKESFKNLWVRGLSEKTRAVDLKTLFSKCGKVSGAKIVTNSKTPYSHFYGFVMMSSSEEATACVERLNHAELHGKILSVEKTMCDFGASMKKKIMNAENSAETIKKSSSEKINENVSMEMEAQKSLKKGEINELEKNAEELEVGETSVTAISEDDISLIVVESKSKESGDGKKEDLKLHNKDQSKEKHVVERSRSRESYRNRYHPRERRFRRSRSRSRERRRRNMEEEDYRRNRRYLYDKHDSKYEERRRPHRDYHRRSPERRNNSRGFDREWEKLKLEEMRLENERLELEREKQRIEHEKLKKEKEDLEKQIRERRAVKRPLEEAKHEEDSYLEDLEDGKLEVVPDFHDEEMLVRNKLVSQHPSNRRHRVIEDFPAPETHAMPRGPHPNESLRGQWKPLEMVDERHYKPRIPGGRNSPHMDEPRWNFEQSSPWISPPDEVRPPEAPGQWRPLLPRWEAPPQPETPYVWLGRPRGPLLPFSAPPPMGHPMFGGPNRFF